MAEESNQPGVFDPGTRTPGGWGYTIGMGILGLAAYWYFVDRHIFSGKKKKKK